MITGSCFFSIKGTIEGQARYIHNCHSMSLLYIISARFVNTEINFDWWLFQYYIKWSGEILSGLIFVAIKPSQASLLYFWYLSIVYNLKLAFPSFNLCQFSWKIKSVISSPQISFPVAWTLIESTYKTIQSVKNWIKF